MTLGVPWTFLMSPKMQVGILALFFCFLREHRLLFVYFFSTVKHFKMYTLENENG